MSIVEKYLEFIQEMPITMECGRKCNQILGMGSDITYTKGGILGGLLGGPFGQVYGMHMPANSLHKLCRAKCNLDKKIQNKRDKFEIEMQKNKVKQAKMKVEYWISKFKSKEPNKAKIMKKVLDMLMRTRF